MLHKPKKAKRATPAVQVTLRKVPLNFGGYDQRGRYYGAPDFRTSDSRAHYLYRADVFVRGGEDKAFEFRASDRAGAQAHLARLLAPLGIPYGRKGG